VTRARRDVFGAVGLAPTTELHASPSRAIGRRLASLRTVAPRLLARRLVQDAVVAALLTGASLVGVFAHLNVEIPEGSGDTGLRALDAMGTGLVLLQTLPLTWRRRAPIAVLAVTGGALFLFVRLGYPPSLASFGFLIALFTVAANRNRTTSIPAGIVCYVGVLLILVLGQEPVEPDAVLAEFLIVGATWWLGDGLRIRRGQLLQLEDRATRLEREREEQAERAVAEERRVIARELHDVVAHNVSIIVAQAGAAQRIFDAAPREAFGVLGTIERIGREALVEMRRLMGFLRTEHDRHDLRSPQPGLGNLGLLVGQFGDAGLPVTLSVEGTVRPLPVGLDLSAYRIVQEALTNVLKHAGPARANVVVRYGRGRVDLIVSDDGRGTPSDDPIEHGPGYGQLGMRERVALFSGVLRVRARPGGGYEVSASLPLDDRPP
jgi:signal transduction histidine kinase